MIKPDESYDPQTQLTKTSTIQYTLQIYKLSISHQKL